MSNYVGQKLSLKWVVHISLLLLVLAWVFPTAGLFVSSFRTADQISASGWWSALFDSTQNHTIRTLDPDSQIEQDGQFVIKGNLFGEQRNATISKWGVSSQAIDAFDIGDTAPLRRGGTIIVQANGDYVMQNDVPFEGSRGIRVFVTASSPPEFTVQNYHDILFNPNSSAGMAKAFFNTLTVSIPATIIPILFAAFAAYALAWMDFPGRAILIAVVVATLVVPLQLAFIPLLRLHNDIGIGKGYIGVWLAHTGFGLSLAIYLLRNYMVGLPKDIIENAKIDGATHFQIFTRIVLPLSFPALASFAIFQFLWTWNDLLVARVFLLDASGDTTVMTQQIVELLGTFGGNWEILSTAAFISIIVPLIVFFALQKYLVRGLLSGSVK